MGLRAKLLASSLLLLPALSFAEPTTSVKGRFADPATHAWVGNVAVKLTAASDTTDVHRATAGDDGKFEIKGLGVHSYKLEATRVGYAPLRMVVRVTKNNQDLGVLQMTSESVPVSGITVTESPAPATQRADTTEYRASAVKVHKDATAEDLVQKLPGVTMENGQIKAQGENVQNLLVNGRPFFGSDPTAAMRNLPADVVDRIQVYDRASDQAEFSGFDDSQSQKTMNFILRDVKAKFGKVYGGYGDQDRYQAGGNATIVRGPTRLTAIGMSNNINQRNFSIQDLFGGLTGIAPAAGGGGPRIMMFGGGGGGGFGGGGGMRIRMGGFGGGAFDPSSFLVGQQTGISTTHSGGLNYVGQWGPKLQLSASTFINGSDNEDVQSLGRQYLPPQDSLAFYDQSTVSDSRSANQRFDGRLEWTPDSLNSVILQPRLYFQNSDGTSDAAGVNRTLSGGVVSAADNHNVDSIDGNNLSSRLTLRHRFDKPGRNLSADVNVGHIRRQGDGTQHSLTDFDSDSTVTSDTLDQKSASDTRTNSFSTRIAFTERLAQPLQAQLIYNPSITRSTADARTLGLDPQSGDYTRPDSALSNTFENRNVVQNGGLALLYTRGPWRLLGNASYQNTRLRSEQTYPMTANIERSFDEFLPSMILSGTFANRRNLRLAWTTSSSPPNIGQLQNVVNNSNPLSLSTGNPGLRPSYNHSISLRVSEADPMRSKSRFLFMNLVRTSHPIANSIFTAPGDTTVDGVSLARGTQLTTPVNLDHSWIANAFAVYSRPLPLLKSILSLNGGGTLNRTPTLLNGRANVGSTYAIRFGSVLASNISPNLDFTVLYQGSYNLSRYTLTASNTGDYYSHTLGLRFNAVAMHGIVVREELNHNLQSRVPTAFGQDVVLWNTTLGKKLLKNDRGEIRVTATDVLEQNKSVNRSVTETYVQDSRDSALGRYVQAVFTYTFR
ncbi:MAG: hypothetical protein E6K80_05570 [Candidatus Eisenbacteria bacterium]|uniref:Outer membrane protein beta-barrel domain-containing protein n=1 Tax=Eiseniibacteriota bacterium TaxID=2212470 RepID=A0A538U6B6_UNCEI|nr:MAG: hypothetical protein E6K80_05570 [Candidatus Eisenbacteria bacterium]